MNITAFTLAQRFVGLKEVSGNVDNPAVMAMLKLDNKWPQHDEVPWCSAFVNYICWLLRLPRSKSLRARSWLEIGQHVHVTCAEPGWDVVVLQRGSGNQPGIDVLDAPGHVGFFGGLEGNHIMILSGNQSNQVSVAPYDRERLLSIRRLV